MIEIQHVRITFENVPLDEGRAGAIVTRALEILERQCAANRRWQGTGQNVIVPPVVLDFVGSNDALLSERVAAALREELDRQFPPESDRAPRDQEPVRGGTGLQPVDPGGIGLQPVGLLHDRVDRMQTDGLQIHPWIDGLQTHPTSRRFATRAVVATPHPAGREGRSGSK